MTVDELMLALHRDYLQTIAEGRRLGLPWSSELPPLTYRCFCKAIALVITGNEGDEQGVLERYLIYERMCRRQRRELRMAHFVASCMLGNPRIEQETRDKLAGLFGAPKLPMVMN